MTRKIAINLLSFDTAALTGVGYFFKRLIEALPPLPEVELVFFCQRRFDLEEIIRIPNSIRFRRVNVPNFPSRIARIAYEQLVLPFRCSRMEVLYSPCVANPVLRFNRRMITTIHDLTPFFVSGKYGRLQSAYVRCITRVLAKSSDTIVTVSESSRNDLIRLIGVNEARIRVVYNFLPEQETHDIRYEPFFLTVGTRQPAKNLSGVIRAFAKFCQCYDTENHRLVVVGASGWGSDEYSSLVSDLSLSERVDFLGYIPEAALNELYATCKGHILLSFYEGFGIPVLEALRWQKPSIASRLSSIPEVMGTTGITVDPRDPDEAALAMKAIADNPRGYLAGRDSQLEKFSAETQVVAFLQVFGITPIRSD